MKRLVLLFVIVLPLNMVEAAIEIYRFNNTEHESLYYELIEELRCLVCQNQNLAASNAPLAKDLRREAYEMIIAGQSRQQIIDFMTSRYGDFVLYTPPLKGSTLLLWIGPFLLLLIGIIVLLRVFLDREKAKTGSLSEAERESVSRLLEDGE